MNLSAYLSFSVTFDLTGPPKGIFQDTSAFPDGVADGLKIIWAITQPDGVTTTGDWAEPDGPLFEKKLRLNSAQGVQQGKYVISMMVDHPDYDPTTKTETFDFSYSPITLSLKESFDVFTPVLLYKDLTPWERGNYDLLAESTLWTAVIGDVATITSAYDTIDLAYQANYYDARYTITFEKSLTYHHQALPFLYLKEGYKQVIRTTADTPLSAAQLLTYLDRQKKTLDDSRLNPYRYRQIQERYKYAEALYSQFKERLCKYDTADLIILVDEYTRVTHNDQHILYNNTNQIIPPYDFDSVCGIPSSGGGGGTWLSYDYDVTEETTLWDTGIIGAVPVSMTLDGIGRKFMLGTEDDIPPVGKFLYVPQTGLMKYNPETPLNAGQYFQMFYLPA